MMNRRELLKTLIAAVLTPIAIELAPGIFKPVEVVEEQPAWFKQAALAEAYLHSMLKGSAYYGIDWSKNDGHGAWVVIDKNTETGRIRVVDYGDIIDYERPAEPNVYAELGRRLREERIYGFIDAYRKVSA